MNTKLLEATSLYLASVLRGIANKRTDVLVGSDRYIYHRHLSVFERACDILWSLGVAEAADNQGNGGFSREQFAAFLVEQGKRPHFPAFFHVPTDGEILRLLNEFNGFDLAVEHRLIAACLGCADHFGELHTKQEGYFTPSDRELGLMNALSAAGYVVRDGHKFLWRTEIAPVMRSIGLWG